MAGLTNYAEDKIMGHLFGGTPYTAPSTYYCGILSVTPTDSASGTEITGGSYARQAISWTVTGGGTAQSASSASLTFPAATTDWGTAVSAGIYDALTGGNLIAFETLTLADFTTANPKTINSGDIFQVDSGNMKITLD